jgi:hypothetical protein
VLLLHHLIEQLSQPHRQCPTLLLLAGRLIRQKA